MFEGRDLATQPHEMRSVRGAGIAMDLPGTDDRTQSYAPSGDRLVKVFDPY